MSNLTESGEMPIIVETPTVVDAPMLVDTPTVVDVPIIVDTPIIVDVPTLVDTPIIVEIPVSEPYVASDRILPAPENTWIEEVEIAGSQLVERMKELIAEGKVRRLIIRNTEDKVLVEIPLTAGVAIGGVVTFFAPVLAGLGALAALVTRVKVQIVRAED